MISDPNLLFRQAGEAYGRGAFAEAVALYRQLQQKIPDHPQILSALGNAEIALGEIEEGVASLRRSLAIVADRPDAWCNLARGLRLLRRFDEALVAVDRALTLAPALFEAWTCRGNVLWDVNRDAEALNAYERALTLRPSDARTHFNHANALSKLKRYDEAIAGLNRALSLAPEYTDAGKRLASLLCDLKRPAEALPLLEALTVKSPDDTELCSLYGMTLHYLGRFTEAEAVLDHVVMHDPSSVVAVTNHGVNEHALGHFEAALADFDRAVELDPRFADAIVDRGTLLRDMGRTGAAEAAYEQALAVDASHPEANWNRGLLALLKGDFESGWPRYEGRWKSKASPGPFLDVPQPQWHGEDVAGKTVFVWSEQGFGDFVQFCRYVPLLVSRGARVLLQVPERLRPLIATLNAPFEMVDTNTVPATFDFHCPLMSLPLAFGTTLATIPAEVPYLKADPEKVKAFDIALGPTPRIGLVWSANLAYIHGLTRHMPAPFVTPLLDFPAAFHVLHKEFRPEDLEFLAQHPELCTHAEAQKDFSDAAALIAAMDLVITIDTVVPHLAGALGKPAWLMLPYAADWRWLQDRDDTPWYPGMRLFRQPVHGDWASVVSAVKTALTGYLRELMAGSAPRTLG